MSFDKRRVQFMKMVWYERLISNLSGDLEHLCAVPGESPRGLWTNEDTSLAPSYIVKTSDIMVL